MPSGASLPVGRHQFPLRIFVPETAPSSYESQFGTNRYTIKVVLKTNSEQVGGFLYAKKKVDRNWKIFQSN